MSEDDNRLWLIRHAPVAGSRGVIHDSDAAADTSDDAAFAALRAKLPAEATQFASPSVRTLETAAALGLRPKPEPNFREQNFGDWTGRRHDDLPPARPPPIAGRRAAKALPTRWSAYATAWRRCHRATPCWWCIPARCGQRS